LFLPENQSIMVKQLLSIWDYCKCQNFTLYMHLHCVKIYSDSDNLVLLLIRNFFVQLKNSEMKQNFSEKNPNNILLIYNTIQLGRLQSFFSVLNKDCRFAEKNSFFPIFTSFLSSGRNFLTPEYEPIFFCFLQRVYHPL
jgi:hypothetical protein